MLSSYNSPEMLALFNRSLANVAGKLHIKNDVKPAIKAVKRGVQQTFVRLEVPNLAEEDNSRFEHFKTKVGQPNRVSDLN
jgi:U3 small nucleolar RNA-associated protein 25